MASPKSHASSASLPKTLARACQFCRMRKIKCDTARPSCSNCIANKRTCVYEVPPRKPRPSTAIINGLQREKTALEEVLVLLKNSSSEDRNAILDSMSYENGKISLPESTLAVVARGISGDHDSPAPSPHSHSAAATAIKRTDSDGDMDLSDDEYDVANFLSVDERGKVGVFGPTSVLHGPSPPKPPGTEEAPSPGPVKYQLIANAAIERQKELDLRRTDNIRGVPTDLALHLLDLHWNRQHHSFLLTYRPAFMRELVTGGSYCSDFLVNAVFACSSKYSDRLEVRDDPMDPTTAGGRFFGRCDELLFQESLLSYSSIPTITGLLLLGSTINARGQASKGWLYTGYALRMVYDLGLHLDGKVIRGNAEEIEIRRRVFWGAFICDKLQSLYLGRPITIQTHDSHVSRDFMDTFEEMEQWTPYIDPKTAALSQTSGPSTLTYIHSVSTFQQLCSLSKIMSRIINQFYVVGATPENSKAKLNSIDELLTAWYEHLPAHLVFEPWSKDSAHPTSIVAPNVFILLTTYYALIILLHRPFITNGHLHPSITPVNSWKRCTTAARNITNLTVAYQSAYPLRRAPYLLSYAVYVACTIHVRNSAATVNDGGDVSILTMSLKFLDELAVANAGVSDPAQIIRKLMAANGIAEIPETTPSRQPTSPNIDELLHMFPQSSPDFGEMSDMQPFTDFSMPGQDLLFGFLNDSFPPLDSLDGVP